MLRALCEAWDSTILSRLGLAKLRPVEIESQWTARNRERVEVFLTPKLCPPEEKPLPKAELGRATLESKIDRRCRGHTAP